MKFRIKIYLISCLFSLNSSHAQDSKIDDLDNCLNEISYDRKRIDKTKTDNITIAFFQDFSDSVVLFLNDAIIYKKRIVYDSITISSTFTGETFSFKKLKKKSKMMIIYVTQKKYINLKINNKYPLYTIHSYKRGICLVAARRNKELIIK